MDHSTIIAKVSGSIAKVYCLDGQDNVINTGSAFVYWKKGLLVTCNHVVAKGDRVMCRFSDDVNPTFHNAKIAVRDTEHDLALLTVNAEAAPIAALSAKSEKTIRPGMPVLFSGYPLSLDDLTTHQGILSAITKDAVGVTTFLIDGTVNAGNSGCPLMNANGELLGVVNAKRREHSDLLNQVEKMALGAISLHGIDLVKIYQALISNVQLGIGYAVPASYIPEHKEGPKRRQSRQSRTKRSKKNIKKASKDVVNL
jgi:S1-C subfamily serine protease